MGFLNVLTRKEMKKILGGYMLDGCGTTYCTGCISDGSGPGCYKWTCNGGMCAPVASNCCIAQVEQY